MGKDTWAAGICNLNDKKEGEWPLEGIVWEEIGGDFSLIDTREQVSISITVYTEQEPLPENPWNADDDAAKR